MASKTVTCLLSSPQAYVERHKIHTDSVSGRSRIIVLILAHIFFTAMFSLKSAYAKIDWRAWDKEKILSPWREFEVYDLLK